MMKLNLDITLPIAAYVEDLSIIYFANIYFVIFVKANLFTWFNE